MTELAAVDHALPHPNEVRGIWGQLDADAIQKYGIEQTPGFETHFIRLSYGHRLAVEAGGPEDGIPIVIMPGTASGRLGHYLTREYLEETGARVYVPDREGYGFSDGLLRSPETAHLTIQAIMQYSGYSRSERIGLVGRSAGVAFAVGCVAVSPELVDSLALVAPIAPREEFEYPDWYAGMGSENRILFEALFADGVFRGLPQDTLRRKRAVAERHLEGMAEQVRRNSLAVLESQGGSQPTDQEAIHNSRTARAHAAALRPGAQGWLADIRTLNDWGYLPMELIKQHRHPDGQATNVRLWAASKDVHTPSGHAEHLIRRIGLTPDEVEMLDGTHFAAAGAMENAVSWCVKNMESKS